MKSWTAHVRPDAPPVLLKEGFSWGALIFGPLWLLARKAWIPAVLGLCATAILLVVPGPFRGILILALIWMFGVFGRDLCRWSLSLRGYALVHVVAAPDEDSALARLLARRPDLIADALQMDAAR